MYVFALSAPPPSQEITVRVCFILGNLVGDDPVAREMVFFRYSALSVLTPVFYNHLSSLLQEVGTTLTLYTLFVLVLYKEMCYFPFERAHSKVKLGIIKRLMIT